MNTCLSIISFLGLYVVVFGQKYNSRFDDIDVDAILANKRVLNNYIKCILYEGPCTSEGREFRSKYHTEKNYCSYYQIKCGY